MRNPVAQQFSTDAFDRSEVCWKLILCRKFLVDPQISIALSCLRQFISELVSLPNSNVESGQFSLVWIFYSRLQIQRFSFLRSFLRPPPPPAPPLPPRPPYVEGKLGRGENESARGTMGREKRAREAPAFFLFPLFTAHLLALFNPKILQILTHLSFQIFSSPQLSVTYL